MTKCSNCFIVYSKMVQSMTGFGSAEKNGYRVEVRSLNHRFFDVYIKAPSVLTQYELEFRNSVKRRFSRGKIDVSIFITDSAHSDVSLNADFVLKLYTSFKKLQDQLSIPGNLDINAITQFREMFIDTSLQFDIGTIVDLLDQALDGLDAMRRQEGEMIGAELRKMTKSMTVMNEKAREISNDALPETKEKFAARLKGLLEGIDIDNNRVLQEAAVLATKVDISEEIVLVGSHLKQFREILDNNDTIGRKLDFILQELNREVNTIASKSSHFAISNIAVEMKTEIEKMREQVQNIQ